MLADTLQCTVGLSLLLGLAVLRVQRVQHVQRDLRLADLAQAVVSRAYALAGVRPGWCGQVEVATKPLRVMLEMRALASTLPCRVVGGGSVAFHSNGVAGAGGRARFDTVQR